VPALPVVLTRRAARQVEAAAAWWRLNRPAAPDALEADTHRLEIDEEIRQNEAA